MNILIVSPHPDDETLGAGGTILKLIAEGHNVYWLNITNIDKYTPATQEQKDKRYAQIEAIKAFYNFTGSFDLKMPTTQLDTVSDSEGISLISNIINTVKPNWLVLPNPSDIHSDHKQVFNWCFSCSKVFRYPFINKILTMEIPSETDFASSDNAFIPNMFVDITPYIDQKLEAIQIYESEIMPHPFPRSLENIKALATIRGAAAGVPYAEGFRILKEII